MKLSEPNVNMNFLLKNEIKVKVHLNLIYFVLSKYSTYLSFTIIRGGSKFYERGGFIAWFDVRDLTFGLQFSVG